MTWAAQMRALVSFPDNCGTNTGWYDWSWSTETPYPGLLSVYLPMEPDLLHFILHWIILAVPRMNNTQRCISYFKYRNIDGRTPSFYSLNTDLGCRWDNLSCQYFNSCCKWNRNYGNMILLICSCVIFLGSLI